MNLYTQWLTMSVMFASGFLLGILLDVYQICKERFHFRGWLLSFIDLVYWFLSACLVFSLLWWSNWGELRLYTFVAIAMGFFIYFKWISILVIHIISKVIRLLEMTLRGIYYLLELVLWKPIVKIFIYIRLMVQGILFIPRLVGERWIISFFKKNREKK